MRSVESSWGRSSRMMISCTRCTSERRNKPAKPIAHQQPMWIRAPNAIASDGQSLPSPEMNANLCISPQGHFHRCLEGRAFGHYIMWHPRAGLDLSSSTEPSSNLYTTDLQENSFYGELPRGGQRFKYRLMPISAGVPNPSNEGRRKENETRDAEARVDSKGPVEKTSSFKGRN